MAKKPNPITYKLSKKEYEYLVMMQQSADDFQECLEDCRKEGTL